MTALSNIDPFDTPNSTGPIGVLYPTVKPVPRPKFDELNQSSQKYEAYPKSQLTVVYKPFQKFQYHDVFMKAMKSPSLEANGTPEIGMMLSIYLILD